MVIGLNHRTAPMAMRERFWISEARRYLALRVLARSEGIEEVALLVTCHRTDFVLWASEPTLAANSLLHFLSVERGLKLTEWEHFYRLLDHAAVLHIFRFASGLDSVLLSDRPISYLRAAWEQASTVGAAGPFLDTLMQKAATVSERVRSEIAIGDLAISIPSAITEVSRELFGSLQGRRVLLFGVNEISELSARQLLDAGALSVSVIGDSSDASKQLAMKLGGTACEFGERWQCMLHSDIVISATGCPHVVLARDEAERIAEERQRSPLLIIDAAMPRDVDPEVRRVDGIVLCDLDGLARMESHDDPQRRTAVSEAEKIVLEEAQAFRNKLRSDGEAPTAIRLRRRLDEICRQELLSFIAERGPFPREEDQALHAITGRVIQRIASSLASELKEIPEKSEQEQMTSAVKRLFHLEVPTSTLAATGSDKKLGEN
jgi:glutamyl-tRNA reductase